MTCGCVLDVAVFGHTDCPRRGRAANSTATICVIHGSCWIQHDVKGT